MIHHGTAIDDRDHVAFHLRRDACVTEPRITGVLIVVLILAIGVCGLVLPPRSVLSFNARTTDAAVSRMTLNEGMHGIRSDSEQG